METVWSDNVGLFSYQDGLRKLVRHKQKKNETGLNHLCVFPQVFDKSNGLSSSFVQMIHFFQFMYELYFAVIRYFTAQSYGFSHYIMQPYQNRLCCILQEEADVTWEA